MSVIQLNHTDLKEFECPICNEYFKKAIFQCITGHSVCEDCNARINNCPFCQNVVGITRNYALETFIDKIQVKCQNELCKSKIKLANYAEHLTKCSFRLPPCKLCNEKAYSDIDEHIRKKHKNYVIENGSVPQTHQLTVCCLEWYTKMFWVKRFVDEGQMYWYAQATARVVDKNAYYLSVAALKPSGAQTRIECPVFLDPMENDTNMRNQLTAGFKKNKMIGCKFYLSVSRKDENLAYVTSIFTTTK